MKVVVQGGGQWVNLPISYPMWLCPLDRNLSHSVRACMAFCEGFVFTNYLFVSYLDLLQTVLAILVSLLPSILICDLDSCMQTSECTPLSLLSLCPPPPPPHLSFSHLFPLSLSSPPCVQDVPFVVELCCSAGLQDCASVAALLQYCVKRVGGGWPHSTHLQPITLISLLSTYPFSFAGHDAD